MITVDNPDTVKQVKALVELMNTQGKLVNVQREGVFVMMSRSLRSLVQNRKYSL